MITLTECAQHQLTGEVRDMKDALAAVRDQLDAAVEYDARDIVAEVIASSRDYRDKYPCCPAGSYATYLIDAAARQLLAGEGIDHDHTPDPDDPESCLHACRACLYLHTAP
jgi:hypothetical protein